MKQTVGNVNVLWAAGVVLQFIVAPPTTSVADVKRPIILID